MRTRTGFVLSILLAGLAPAAFAQETANDYAWKPLLKHGGVDFTYLYYYKPGSIADGVVVKLANWNDYAIRYRFKVVFRTDGAEHVEEVEGTLGARQAKTGDRDGLYWMPFKDGRPILEFGLRGYQITPLPADDTDTRARHVPGDGPRAS
jgi:hypothetical protein